MLEMNIPMKKGLLLLRKAKRILHQVELLTRIKNHRHSRSMQEEIKQELKERIPKVKTRLSRKKIGIRKLKG